MAYIRRRKGAWLLFPKLTKTERKIFKLLEEGQDPNFIIQSGKDKNGKLIVEGMSKANVYKTIKKLEKEGLYEHNGKAIDGTAKEIC